MITLQKQTNIPLLGFGTWKLNGSECIQALNQALEIGYRHIDTADMYKNHREVGSVIKNWPRKEIYLVTKIFINGNEKVNLAVNRFLEELSVDYIDLLLIHWPSDDNTIKAVLDDMVKVKEQALIKNIGVSNFVRSHLKILENFPILTNQIEMHPYLQRKELVNAYLKNNIKLSAYRPVAKGAFEKDAIMLEVGNKYGKTPSQIALKWLVQQDVVAIPKAANIKHAQENFSIFDFELDDDDLNKINSLDSGKRFCSPDGLPILDD